TVLHGDHQMPGALQVVDAGSLGTVFIMFMCKAPAVADVRVRQAIAYATDRATLNQALNYGIFPLARTPFGSGLAPHERVLSFPEFNLERATALVKEIGKPVKVTLSIQATPATLQTAQALQQMWRKAGIETELRQEEQVQLIRDAITHNYEVVIFRWPGRGDPDLNVYQFFYSKSPRNYSQYTNPEMDRLLVAGRETLDPAKRLKIYSQVNDLLARDVPYFFYYYYTAYMITSPNVHGVLKVPDGLLRVSEVWKGN
ncbi:MAG TPA: ABC transporter substrate-binding protein, partial [bacterium]|nr:ABC transporter substrate-binding protein [bacterium]